MADVLPFDTAESRRRTSQSAAAQEGRKRLRAWRCEVESKVRAGLLSLIDLAVADALMNFPSSVLSGFCWAGQARIARTQKKSLATVERSIARLKREGLLQVTRQARGRTCCYSFLIDSPPSKMRGLDPSKMRGQAPSKMRGQAGLDPSFLRGESNKNYESLEQESSPNPPRAPERAAPPQRQPSEEAWTNAVHNRAAGAIDRAAIRPTYRYVELLPFSDEWKRERDRKVAAGERVGFMDERAAEGRPWPVRVEGGER